MLVLQTFSEKGPLGEIKQSISFNFRTIVRLPLALLGQWSSILTPILHNCSLSKVVYQRVFLGLCFSHPEASYVIELDLRKSYCAMKSS